MSRGETRQPTLRAQWLAQRMRELRQRRGLSTEEAAKYFGKDRSALGRYERADWPFQRTDVHALLDVYRVFDGRDRAQLLQLCDDAWRTDQWDVDFADAFCDSTFVDYTWLESRAALIGAYTPSVLHGLLQTREYAEAMIRLSEGGAPEEKIARWVELRMRRQRVLDGGQTRFAAIVDNAVLRRAIGGPAVLRAQLAHLAALVQRPHIEIRILPERVNLAARFNGAFSVFRMPAGFPEVAYLENFAGRMYLESPRSQRFVLAYDQLREAALSANESVKLIRAMAEELTT
ncbi:helix-turn-helix domain-containing protein [Plantactinospora sp. CA-294935]|uniref:helix-turn-helix domain-containing protein n=1 Tax=Plantactinospora sp. CA-294935 TaxID=3240012 RepID=UPI003D8CDDA5